MAFRRTMNENLVVVIAVLISFASLVSCSPTWFSRDNAIYYARSTTANTCNNERVFGVTTSSSTALSVRGGSVQELTTLEEVQKIIADEAEGGKLVVLYFTANNCPPCKMIAPTYVELSESEEFENDVLFLKVNVNDSPETAAEYNVDGWPTFLFIKNGKVLSEMVGGNAAREGLYAMVSLWARMK